ncbi:MAG: caspase family protein [Dysgonamonadaceae bacterium]|jgi:hypothetical protein|nr:caspase family protein [Dysgonamonadaceae bacterium]
MQKLISILLTIFVATHISAQTLHTILVANEKETYREKDRAEDVTQMDNLFKDVANCISYQYNSVKKSDEYFSPQEINKEINNLNTGQNDIIVFYYSGHGKHPKEDKSKWPTLEFNAGDKDDYPFTEIVKSLDEKAKNAKLILCIADCCNDFYNLKGNHPNSDQELQKNKRDIYIKNIQNLFIGFSGKKTIIISAASKGQLSWSSTSGPYYGSFFRGYFQESIYKLASDNNSPDWYSIMNLAIKQTESNFSKKQTPQYEVHYWADGKDYKDIYKTSEIARKTLDRIKFNPKEEKYYEELNEYLYWIEEYYNKTKDCKVGKDLLYIIDYVFSKGKIQKDYERNQKYHNLKYDIKKNCQ